MRQLLAAILLACILASPVFAANVAFESATFFDGDSVPATTNHTFTHTNTSGNAVYLLVCSRDGSAGAGVDVTAASYDGAAMTNVADVVTTSSNVRMEWWRKTSPSTGSNLTVAFTSGASTEIIAAYAISLTGVNTSAPGDTGSVKTNQSDNATSSSLSVDSTVGGLVMDALCVEGGSAAATMDGSQTRRLDQQNLSTSLIDMNSSEEAGTGAAVAMSWTTIGAFRDFVHIGFNVAASTSEGMKARQQVQF